MHSPISHNWRIPVMRDTHQFVIFFDQYSAQLESSQIIRPPTISAQVEIKVGIGVVIAKIRIKIPLKVSVTNPPVESSKLYGRRVNGEKDTTSKKGP